MFFTTSLNIESRGLQPPSPRMLPPARSAPTPPFLVTTQLPPLGTGNASWHRTPPASATLHPKTRWCQVMDATGATRAYSAPFALVEAPSLAMASGTHVDRLEKGGTYEVAWTASGTPFPVRGNVCACLPVSLLVKFRASGRALGVDLEEEPSISAFEVSLRGQPSRPASEASLRGSRTEGFGATWRG